MSYKATAWAYDLVLKGPAKPVLVALADFADEAGSCYPGQEQLALMTGLSLSTVARALRRLEQLNLLTREHRYDKRGYRTSDRFHLAVGSQVLPVTAPTGQSAYQAESLPGTVTPPTGQSDGAIRTSFLEPSEEPSGGALAASTAPPPTSIALSPTCRRHPDGTDLPCAACRKARIAWEQALAAVDAEADPPLPVQLRPSTSWRPGMCIPHLQKLGDCEMCEREGIA